MIKKEGHEAIFVLANMASEADIDRLVTKTVETFGKVDILVNNAGISGGLAFLTDITADDWDQLMAVNLRGPFLAAKRVFPEMVKNGKGNIINIASMASTSGRQRWTALHCIQTWSAGLYQTTVPDGWTGWYSRKCCTARPYRYSHDSESSGYA